MSYSIWFNLEELTEQVLLGGERFLEKVRALLKGDPQEQRSAARLGQVRPALEQVIACVEEVRGENWEGFRDRHGDRGRDLVLYLGRSVCGLSLSELACGVGAKGYAAVAMAIRRYSLDLRWNGVEREPGNQRGHILTFNN